MTDPADALLIVDVQREYAFGRRAVEDSESLVARLTDLLTSARAAGATVVHVQDDGEGTGPKPDTEGWRLVLEPHEGEHVVRKAADDSFAGTRLEDLLVRAGAQRLAVVGIQSEMCVSATVRGALTRQYDVVLPRDGHATYPIPAIEDGPDEVPAAVVSRVAEWALGDGVHVVPHTTDVRFSRARSGG